MDLHVQKGVKNFFIQMLDNRFLEKSLRFGFQAIKNEVECEAYITCLKLTKILCVIKVTIKSDS